MSRTLAFWILFAVTLGVYLSMLTWSLPVVSFAADGGVPFDMRPAGYAFDEAKAFLTTLTPDGAAFYRDVQQRLDLLYPALLAATLFFAILRLVPPQWGVWRWLLPLAAIPGAVFDYLENHAVRQMLAAGADGITPEAVAAASRWTVLKSQATTIAMVILLGVLLVWTVSRLRTRGRRA